MELERERERKSERRVKEQSEVVIDLSGSGFRRVLVWY